MQGLVQEIAVNSVIASFTQNHLVLLLTPEIQELVTPANQLEISRAIGSKLGVSLTLEIKAQAALEAETPHEARLRGQQDQRQWVIAAIKEDTVVKKLQRALGAELVESSVVKIN